MNQPAPELSPFPRVAAIRCPPSASAIDYGQLSSKLLLGRHLRRASRVVELSRVWETVCPGCEAHVRFVEPARGRPPVIAKGQPQPALFPDALVPTALGKFRRGGEGWWIGDCVACGAACRVAEPPLSEQTPDRGIDPEKKRAREPKRPRTRREPQTPSARTVAAEALTSALVANPFGFEVSVAPEMVERLLATISGPEHSWAFHELSAPAGAIPTPTTGPVVLELGWH